MKPIGAKDWTPYEDMVCDSLRKEGLSWAQIAIVLKRSRESVVSRVDRLERHARITSEQLKQPYHPLHDNVRLLAVLSR